MFVFNVTEVTPDAELAGAIMRRHFRPSLIKSEAWEGYTFADLEIKIKESTDCYGAVLWPSVRFILLRRLLKYSNYCFVIGTLTLFFLSRPWYCVIFLTPIRKDITLSIRTSLRLVLGRDWLR